MEDRKNVVRGSSMSIFIILSFPVLKVMDEIRHHSLCLTNVVCLLREFIHPVLGILERIFLFP